MPHNSHVFNASLKKCCNLYAYIFWMNFNFNAYNLELPKEISKNVLNCWSESLINYPIFTRWRNCCHQRIANTHVACPFWTRVVDVVVFVYGTVLWEAKRTLAAARNLLKKARGKLVRWVVVVKWAFACVLLYIGTAITLDSKNICIWMHMVVFRSRWWAWSDSLLSATWAASLPAIIVHLSTHLTLFRAGSERLGLEWGHFHPLVLSQKP